MSSRFMDRQGQYMRVCRDRGTRWQLISNAYESVSDLFLQTGSAVALRWKVEQRIGSYICLRISFEIDRKTGSGQIYTVIKKLISDDQF